MTDHATVCYSYSALSDDNEHRKLPSSFTSLVSVAQGQRLRTLVGSSFTSAFTEKLWNIKPFLFLLYCFIGDLCLNLFFSKKKLNALTLKLVLHLLLARIQCGFFQLRIPGPQSIILSSSCLLAALQFLLEVLASSHLMTKMIFAWWIEESLVQKKRNHSTGPALVWATNQFPLYPGWKRKHAVLSCSVNLQRLYPISGQTVRCRIKSMDTWLIRLLCGLLAVVPRQYWMTKPFIWCNSCCPASQTVFPRECNWSAGPFRLMPPPCRVTTVLYWPAPPTPGRQPGTRPRPETDEKFGRVLCNLDFQFFSAR